MTNEEVMSLLTEMGQHEGGMENWVMDNAWVAFANRVSALVADRCADIAYEAEPFHSADLIRKAFGVEK
jgi:hypothetical protein